VTFYARSETARGNPSAPTTRAYQVFHDTSGLRPAPPCSIAPSSQTTPTTPRPATPRHHRSCPRPHHRGTARAAAPAAPSKSAPCRPRRATHVVTFERSVNGAPGPPSAWTAHPRLHRLRRSHRPQPPRRTPISYRAKLLEPNGTNVTKRHPHHPRRRPTRHHGHPALLPPSQ